MSKKNEPSLNQQLAELDEIMARFEQDDFDIETAIEKFEQGAALARQIKTQLDSLENKVTVLKQRFDSTA